MPLVSLLVPALALVASAPPTPTTTVAASLAYTNANRVTAGDPAWSGTRITITRNGTVAAKDVPLPAGADRSLRTVPALTVVDLDDDGEREVLVDLTTAPADALEHTVIYRWSGGRYRASVATWGAAGHRLEPATSRRTARFTASDSRLAALFGDALVGPLRILTFVRGRLADVTAADRAALAVDAARQARTLRSARRTGDDPRPALAARAVDLARLGRDDDATAEIRAAACAGELRTESAAAFTARVNAHLRRWRYPRSARI